MVRKLLIAAAILLVVLAAAYGVVTQMAQNSPGLRIVGSGATFPFPLYSAWFRQFGRENKGVTIDFQAKGSGAGIQDLINSTVDFAASDAAMTPAQIEKVENGVVLLPMTAGLIVLSYNLPGNPKNLKLPRDIYVDIFLGRVARWNDPRIVAANPDIQLPDLPVTVVRRSDSSGTTFVFTKHLSAISPAFTSEVGQGTSVPWPAVPSIIAAPRNDGVASTIRQTPGAIGYIEYNFAKMSNIEFALLQNRSGAYVEAGAESGATALAGADFPPDLIVWVEDPADPKAYPIASFTWMLFYREQDPEKAKYLRKMVEFGLTDGQKVATQMGYIPLPENVVKKVRAASAEIR
jgi:phosphate transport system substrate-binding protein